MGLGTLQHTPIHTTFCQDSNGATAWVRGSRAGFAIGITSSSTAVTGAAQRQAAGFNRRHRRRRQLPSGAVGRLQPPSTALHGVVDLPDQLFEDVLEKDDADGDAVGVLHAPQVSAGSLHGREHILE